MRQFLGGLGAVITLTLILLFVGPKGRAEAAVDPNVYLVQHAGQVKMSNSQAATDTAGIYNGGRYYYGTLTSPIYATPIRFDTLVPSWNAATPAGTWVQLKVKVRSLGQWSEWLDMGVWAGGTASVKRHSTYVQPDPNWRVATDAVVSRYGATADAYRYELRLMATEPSLSPTVSKVSFVSSNSYRHGEFLGIVPLEAAWGVNLPVPPRSQMVYAGGGEAWCSPTSLSMVMAYWADRTGQPRLDQGVPAVAEGTYDYAYGGWGNWPFNTAYASEYGLEATVSRFGAIEQAERWIEAGIPVIASVAWDNSVGGQRLAGAPLTWSDGHLLVVRGFTASGDVIVNDPAAGSNAAVPRVYERDDFSRAWFRNPNSSGGIAYLIHPAGWATPGSYAAEGSW